MRKLYQKSINDFVEQKMRDGPLQGSAEWHLREGVGGSSIATIQGVNPYSSVLDYISERIGVQVRGSSIQMEWGNMLEPVIQEIVEYQKKTSITGCDIFVRDTETV